MTKKKEQTKKNKIKYFILVQYDKENKPYLEVLKALQDMEKIELKDFQANDPFEGILSRMRRCINNSDIVISILTDYKPSILQEVGMSIGLGKVPLVISESKKDIYEQIPILKCAPVLEYPSSNFSKKLVTFVRENVKNG